MTTQAATFGFLGRPFQAAPQDELFVPLEPTVDALEQLAQAAIKGDGIGVLTAPPGAGKTVVCRALQARLSRDFATVLLPNSSFPTRRAMLQSVLYELNCDYAGLTEQETRLKLLKVAQSVLPERGGLVLIADEAHLLSPRLLEELRGLTNHVEQGQPLIRVLVSGQLSLEELLTAPELQSLNYRITCHATLEPLTLQQSARYIDERLVHVGGDVSTLFSPEAIEMICRISDGNPRCLNQIADTCLSHAAEHGPVPIPAATVRLVLRELKQLPLQWNESVCDQMTDEEQSIAISAVVGNEFTDDETGDDWQEFETGLDACAERSVSKQPPQAMSQEHAEEPAWSSNVATIEVGNDDWRPVNRRPRKSSAETKPSRSVNESPVSSQTVEIVAAPGDVLCASRVKESSHRPNVAKTTVARPVPPASTSGELQELPVDDNYAALDRVREGHRKFDAADLLATCIDWTSGNTAARSRSRSPEENSANVIREPAETAPATLPVIDKNEDNSPEENIHRVIQAVTDAVAFEIARDRPSPRPVTATAPSESRTPVNGQPAGWRATPVPGAYDVVQPEPADHHQTDDEPCWEPAEESSDNSIRMTDIPLPEHYSAGTGKHITVHAAPPSEPHEPSDRNERPYARLFSRFRRSQAHV